MILDLDGNGAAINGYALAGNRIVAQTDANHTASYFVQDALGSTRGLTSGSTVTQSYSYDAFGALLGDLGSLATNSAKATIRTGAYLVQDLPDLIRLLRTLP